MKSALALFGLLAAQGVASAQATTVATVPWLGDPTFDHVVFNGGSLVLQGVATVQPGCTITAATWDPGDGSGPTAIPFGNPRVLELSHTYAGIPGQPFIATLAVTDSCGTTATDIFRIRVAPKTLDVEVNMAIDKGLWNVHRRMNLSSSGGVPTGYWTSQDTAAATASSVQAFEINGHLEVGDPFEDPYVDNVKRGLAHVMTTLSSFAIAPQPAGDPDANGNGIGLYYSSQPVYVGGQLIDAIVASLTPNAVAVTGGANVIGRTYGDIVQDMLDAYAWGQDDASFCDRGGWRYGLNNDADNSTSQWWAIGGIAAERLFGSIVPQFVKDENLNFWLVESQTFDGTFAGNDGRWGYDCTGPIDGNGMNTTPSGLVQMILDGELSNSPRFDAAERFMVDNWAQLVPANRIYGMFATAKAMRLALPAPIELMNGTFDWYGGDTTAGDPVNGVARHLVSTQQSDFSWDGSVWVVDDLASAWAIIILSPTIVEPPPVAVCQVDPQTTGVNVPIMFDGTQSFHPTPGKAIVAWEWDFDDDGVYDATGSVVTHSYPTLGTKTVRLRVTDNTIPAPLISTTTCPVDIIPPPIPPNSNPGGPYTFCLGTDPFFKFDGTHSSDADGTIVKYEWDFNPQPLNLDFAEGLGPIVDATAFFTGLGPGTYNAALRVTDNDGGTNVDFTTVTVTPPGPCPHVPPIYSPESHCGEEVMAGVGIPLVIDVCALDTDAGDVVKLELVSALPAGAALNPPLPASGNPACTQLTWTPTNGQVASYVVKFKATDSFGLVTNCDITLTVAECYLLIGNRKGSDVFEPIPGGHVFTSQVGQIQDFYPVTMQDIPWVLQKLNTHSNRVHFGTVQVVMWNPQVFPSNPDQYTDALDVWFDGEGNVVYERYGSFDNMSIGIRTRKTAPDEVMVKFPFSINSWNP